MTTKKIVHSWQGMDTSDGAGVKLRRILGSKPGLRLDPFLMLDHFSSDDPNDYIAGFPAHPHRGFETVTYIVDGHMQHKDHLGNEGDLRAGGVQWMLAGKGIIHEEMPQQENGLLRGFQIWLNLPAAEKMQEAYYEDVPAEAMPWQAINDQAQIKCIAGQLAGNALQPLSEKTTAPIIADIALEAHAELALQLPAGHHSLIYVFEGSVRLDGQTVEAGLAAELSLEESTLALSSPNGARILLIAGKPIKEPIAQYGPFVMNTQAEIRQAIDDYNSGQLTK